MLKNEEKTKKNEEILKKILRTSSRLHGLGALRPCQPLEDAGLQARLGRGLGRRVDELFDVAVGPKVEEGAVRRGDLLHARVLRKSFSNSMEIPLKLHGISSKFKAFYGLYTDFYWTLNGVFMSFSHVF